MLRILHFGPSQRFLRGPDRLSPSGAADSGPFPRHHSKRNY